MAAADADTLIELGRVLGAHGVRGAMRVRVPAGRDSVLPDLRRLVLEPEPPAPAREFAVQQCRWQGDNLVVVLDTLTDREAAAEWRGAAVKARRGDFPPLAPGEFYWIDLIGRPVVNLQDVLLGRVADIEEHGAAPFMTIEAGDGRAYRIPLVPAYLIDVGEQALRVDWQPDWD